MTKTELRAAQCDMRHRNSLASRQAAMRKRWVRRRDHEAQLRALGDEFLREFDQLCDRYIVPLHVKFRMKQAFQRKMESRDERRLRLMKCGKQSLI